MPPDWKVIRTAREEITDWLIHWTRYQLIPEPDRKFVSELEPGFARPTCLVTFPDLSRSKI